MDFEEWNSTYTVFLMSCFKEEEEEEEEQQQKLWFELQIETYFQSNV